METGDDPGASGAFALRFEYANENRQAAIALGGTGVAILTFLLVFLSDRFHGLDWSGILFRATLAVVVLSLFLVGIAGTYYYFLIEALERRRSDLGAILQIAELCFVSSVALLLLEPALILITLGIYDVGALAVGLWIVSLGVIAHGRRRFRSAASAT
ncbi:MAG TPA: hypothetical protein VMH78_07050 [Thermoplasmata archaeon]|nr:hypothetical protein [Thermoplasmata archaeon]